MAEPLLAVLIADAEPAFDSDSDWDFGFHGLRPGDQNQNFRARTATSLDQTVKCAIHRPKL
jgi:hypothetical protein